MNQKDIKILTQLRNNARMNLTKMSKKTGIPISTIFDKLKTYPETIIKKHTTLLNFEELGYNTRAKILLRTSPEHKAELKEYLLKNPQTNSLFRINNGYDFMIEAIFTNIKEMEEFIEKIQQRFKIEKIEYYYIIDDLKRETFMTDSYLYNPNT